MTYVRKLNSISGSLSEKNKEQAVSAMERKPRRRTLSTTALVLGWLYLACSLLCPPWHYTLNGGQYPIRSHAGHYSVYNPPIPDPRIIAAIDWSRQSLIIVFIVVVTAGAWYGLRAFEDRRTKRTVKTSTNGTTTRWTI